MSVFLCWCIYCESGHGFGFYCSVLLSFYKFYLGTRLSISFQYVSVDVSILFGVVRGCCHRLFVAVTVDYGFIFVGDGHGISQAD